MNSENSPRIIAIGTQKGGEGKTTTSVNLAANLAIGHGKRVLLIDADPQCNATFHFGISEQPNRYLGLALTKQVALTDLVLETEVENLHILPSSPRLSGDAVVVLRELAPYFLLSRAMKAANLSLYDYVIIDMSPAMDWLALNVFCAANELIVPVEASPLGLLGVTHSLGLLGQAKQDLNAPIRLLGILLTKFNHTKICSEATDSLETEFKGDVFSTRIRANVSLKEAPSHGKPIILYAPRSTGAEDYAAFAKEIEQRPPAHQP